MIYIFPAVGDSGVPGSVQPAVSHEMPSQAREPCFHCREVHSSCLLAHSSASCCQMKSWLFNKEKFLGPKSYVVTTCKEWKMQHSWTEWEFLLCSRGSMPAWQVLFSCSSWLIRPGRGSRHLCLSSCARVAPGTKAGPASFRKRSRRESLAGGKSCWVSARREING